MYSGQKVVRLAVGFDGRICAILIDTAVSLDVHGHRTTFKKNIAAETFVA